MGEPNRALAFPRPPVGVLGHSELRSMPLPLLAGENLTRGNFTVCFWARLHTMQDLC